MHFYFALFSFQGSDWYVLLSLFHTVVGTMWTSPLVSKLLCVHHTVVGTSGLEPPTSRLSGVRSNHLSYAPIR